MSYLFPSGLPSRLLAGAGVPHVSYGIQPTYEQWYASVGGPAGYPYAPPAQYGGVVYGTAPVAFGVAGAPKRYTIEISAPGAKEIRVWQVNHGGRRWIKNILKEKGKFKTWGRVKNKRADSPALIEFKVFWKKSAGGGTSTHGPTRFGKDKSWTLTRPSGLSVDGADDEGTLADVTTAVTDIATSWTDARAASASGEGAPAAQGGLPGWVIPAGVGVAVGVPILALVVKRLRKRGEPPVEAAPASTAGQGARRRRRRTR